MSASRTEEPSLSLRKSMLDAGNHLTKRAQGAYLLALARYYFYGEEPTDLPRDAANVFKGMKYSVQRGHYEKD